MARDFRKTLDMNPTEVRDGVGQIDFIKKLKKLTYPMKREEAHGNEIV